MTLNDRLNRIQQYKENREAEERRAQDNKKTKKDFWISFFSRYKERAEDMFTIAKKMGECDLLDKLKFKLFPSFGGVGKLPKNGRFGISTHHDNSITITYTSVVSFNHDGITGINVDYCEALGTMHLNSKFNEFEAKFYEIVDDLTLNQ